MKAELKQKWIDALRSGEFAQGTGTLKEQVGQGCDATLKYCCLGVLREVAGLPWVPREISNACRYFNPPTNVDAGGWLHEAEALALGLDPVLAAELAYRNDGNNSYTNHSFAEIAAIIEERVTVE